MRLLLRRGKQSCDSPTFSASHASCAAFRSFLILVPIFLQSKKSILSSPLQSLSMDPESRNGGGKPFVCDACDHRFTKNEYMQKHKRTVHGNDFFQCPLSGCQFSSSWKKNLRQHLKGFHATAGSFACDHPGCTFKSTWQGNISKHKRQVHSDEKPFACNHTGCSFRTKMSNALSSHKNAVHLNIRDKRCHVCEKGFLHTCHLRAHMTTHEGDGHEMAECEDCSVNLRYKSSQNKRPAAGKLFSCEHQGCDYRGRRKGHLLSHRKHVHSEERLFPCNYAGCSVRCKTKSQLTSHQKRVHLKIKTKRCHVCDRRFFLLSSLRDHMMSRHQTEDHDIDDCENCVTHLKKNYKLSLAQMAASKRRAANEGTAATAANMQDIKSHKKNAEDEEKNSFACKGIVNEMASGLNDELIDVHVDMQLLSWL